MCSIVAAISVGYGTKKFDVFVYRALDVCSLVTICKSALNGRSHFLIGKREAEAQIGAIFSGESLDHDQEIQFCGAWRGGGAGDGL